MPARTGRQGRIGALWALPCSDHCRKSTPALATDFEPVSVRLPPRFEAIRATGRHHRTSSPQPPKSAIVEAVAHLSVELLERYALKELSEAEMLRVEKHVASCPKCRDHLLRDWEGFMSPDVT